MAHRRGFTTAPAGGRRLVRENEREGWGGGAWPVAAVFAAIYRDPVDPGGRLVIDDSIRVK